MVERKLFLQIQSINIMYPNEENMIVMPITKRTKMVMSIQVCVISWKNIDYEEMVEKKALHATPTHQYRVCQYGEHDCHANKKKNGDILGIQVYLRSRMDFD